MLSWKIYIYSWYFVSACPDMQCIQKIFRPLHLFHILLCCSLMLKLIQYFFPLINLHSISHNDKAKTGFLTFLQFKKKVKTKISHWHKLYSVRWQRLQPQVFLGMMLHALHTWIWGLSAILLCRSSQALSGRMGTVGGQPFLGLSRDVQLGSNQGSGWATQGHSQSLRCLGCVLRVIVLLISEPSGQSEVRILLGRWWAVPTFLQTWHLELRPNQSWFHQTRESFMCLIAYSKQDFMCLSLRRGLHQATQP